MASQQPQQPPQRQNCRFCGALSRGTLHALQDHEQHCPARILNICGGCYTDCNTRAALLQHLTTHCTDLDDEQGTCAWDNCRGHLVAGMRTNVYGKIRRHLIRHQRAFSQRYDQDPIFRQQVHQRMAAPQMQAQVQLQGQALLQAQSQAPQAQPQVPPAMITQSSLSATGDGTGGGIPLTLSTSGLALTSVQPHAAPQPLSLLQIPIDPALQDSTQETANDTTEDH